MKTKIQSLGSLIKNGRFDWVNPDIESNFKADEVRSADYKIFHFDRYISSDDAVKEIEQAGFLAANLTELLAYAVDNWNGKDWVIALGSVAKLNGSRHVPFLGRGRFEAQPLPLLVERWLGRPLPLPGGAQRVSGSCVSVL